MKQYEFYSELPPEAVLERIAACSRPMKWGWQAEENQVFAKVLPDRRFYLAKTGGFLQFRPWPFAGSVEPRGTGSRIVGGFSLNAGARRLILGMSMFSFLLVLAVTGAPGLALAAAMLYGGILCGVMRLGMAMARPSRRETLRFIEDHLLQKQVYKKEARRFGAPVSQ